MEKRIGVAAAFTVFTIGTIFAVSDLAGWVMPDGIAKALVGILSFMAIVGGVVVLHGLWVVSKSLRLTKGLQWPVYDTTREDPNQWLLDIAAHDAKNPQRQLHLLSQHVVKWDFEITTRRPWIELGFKYLNGGMHTILIGPAEGRPKYQGDELVDPIESSGRSRMPRGHIAEYRVKVVLPREVVETVKRSELDLEVARSTSLLRTISLSGVTFQLESEPTDGNESCIVPAPLGIGDTFIVGGLN